MTFEEELLTILNQIPGAIEKAFAAFVQRHPGHGNQKVHGNRFGTGQAKESLRRLKDDKGAREQYKARARARDPGRMDSRQLQEGFTFAKTAKDRAKFADEMGRRSGFADKTVAKTRDEIPKIDDLYPSPGVIGSRGKLSVFLDDNGAHSIGPVVQNVEGEYITGTFGKVRRVKPEFSGEGGVKSLGDVLQGLDLQHDSIKAFERIYSAPKAQQPKLMSEFLAHKKAISTQAGKRAYELAHGKKR